MSESQALVKDLLLQIVEEAVSSYKSSDVWERFFNSDSDSDVSEAEEDGKPFKVQLYRHELQTAAHLKGLLRCVANDSSLSKSVRTVCEQENICDFELLSSLDDNNYPDILNSCKVPYSIVYSRLRRVVCDKLTSQLVAIKTKLQNFIESRQNQEQVLLDALENINSLLQLDSDARANKFEENNFSTTSWLESVVQLIRRSFPEAQVEQSSSSDSDEEDNQNQIKILPTPDSLCEPSTSRPTIRIANFAVDPEFNLSPAQEELISDPTFVDVNDIGQDDDEFTSSTSAAGKCERKIFACFPNVSEEKLSKYKINKLNCKGRSRQFIIFNSVNTDEEHSLVTKLFISAEAYRASMSEVTEEDWNHVEVKFIPDMNSPEHVLFLFSKSSLTFRAELPVSAMMVQKLLDQDLSVFLLSEKRLLQVSKEYPDNRAFCNFLTRNSREFLAMRRSKNLGYEWLKLRYSREERNHRISALLRSDPWINKYMNRTKLNLIESEAFRRINKAIESRISEFSSVTASLLNQTKVNFKTYQNYIQNGIEKFKVSNRSVENHPKSKEGETSVSFNNEASEGEELVCFPFFRYEKDNSYLINLIEDSESGPEEYHIFTMFQDNMDSAEGKLFIHKSNFGQLENVDRKIWKTVRYKFFPKEEESKQAKITFPNPLNIELLVQTPNNVTDMNLNLKDHKNFHLSMINLHMIQNQYLTSGGYFFCNTFSRFGEIKEMVSSHNQKQLFCTELLGCDWIRELFTPAAINQRLEKIRKIFPNYHTAVRIEKEARGVIKGNDHIFNHIFSSTKNVGNNKNLIWKVFSEANTLFEEYESYVKYQLQKELDKMVKTPGRKNISVLLTSKTPASSLRPQSNVNPRTSCALAEKQQESRDPFLSSFTCTTCMSNSGMNLQYKKLFGPLEVKCHVQTSNFNIHGIVCHSCNEIFSVTKSPSVFELVSLHTCSKKHLTRQFESLPEAPGAPTFYQLSDGCELCGEHKVDLSTHLRGSKHSESMKVLQAYLDCCHMRNSPPFNYPGYSPSLASIQFFFQILKYQVPTIIHSRDLGYKILRHYIQHVEDLSVRGRVRLDFSTLDQSVIFSAMEPNVRYQSICFGCEKTFSSHTMLESHLNSSLHSTQPPLSRIVKCLRCNKLFSKYQFLDKSHLVSCKLKSLSSIISNPVRIDIDSEELNSIAAAKTEIPEIVLSDDESDSESVVEEREVSPASVYLSEDEEHPDMIDIKEEVIEIAPKEKSLEISTFDKMFGIEREDNSDHIFENDITIPSAKRVLDPEDDSGVSKKTKIAEFENQEDKKEENEEYFYFCLDCESHSPESCSHLSHPRVPIGINIAQHFSRTGHSRLQPIRDFVRGKESRLLALHNVSYSSNWGSRVRKSWKKMVLAGEITSVDYGSTRRCLKCNFRGDNAVDMFLHIKTHL